MFFRKRVFLIKIYNMGIFKTLGETMTLNFPEGDGSGLGFIFSSILTELEDKQKNKDKLTVGAFLNERLSHFVESHLLNPEMKETLEKKFDKFKGKTIKSLNSKDFLTIHALFKESLTDSGFEEESLSKLEMIQEAIKRLEKPHTLYQLKECILELQDPILKRDCINFFIQNDIDPTITISRLSTLEKEKLSKFFKQRLVLEEKQEDITFSKKDSEIFLSKVGIKAADQKKRFSEKAKALASYLSKAKHQLCVTGMSDFQPGLLTIAASKEALENTLEVKKRFEDFPVCSLVQVDLLTEQPRASYLNVKFPGAPGVFLASREKISELFRRIGFFADTIQCSAEKKERIMTILSFFCTQHIPNGCMIMFRKPFLEKLLEVGAEDFTTRLSSFHLEFNPIYREDGSIKPLAFQIDFSAVLDVCPDVSYESSSYEEKEKIQKALTKIGLGSCFTFDFSGSLVIDCSEENPEVLVTDYKIA